MDASLAKRMRQSLFDSFERIVDTALQRDVDALIISGDLYDESTELPSTRMWLSQQLSRLSIPVYICHGNHDSDTSWDESIPYPDNVHEFGTEPGRFDITDDIEIVGASYENWHETRNLASMLRGNPEKFTIACIHCDVDADTDGYTYAPCKSSDLIGKSIDYWALGHIHKRVILSESPYVVYPGNTQGRSFKETGPKGAYLVTLLDSKVLPPEFIPTHTFIWKDITLDIEGKTLNDIMSELKPQIGNRTIARISFTGMGILDQMLRKNASDVCNSIRSFTGSPFIRIEVDTSPEIDFESRINGKDMTGSLIRTGEYMKALSKEELIDIICSNKVASRYRDYYEYMDEDDIRSMVDEALKGVLSRMGAGV